MRILALDVGDKTIGVAASDALLLTAQAVEVIRRRAPAEDLARLRVLVTELEADTIVVGLPKNMNGSIGPRAESAQEFAASLANSFPDVNIRLWDERLSTVAAERTLLSADVSRAKRRKVIDKVAAAVILQGYLDHLQATKLRGDFLDRK